MAKILAVDDEPAILEMIESILNKDGHLVTKVSNPLKINMEELHRNDMILLDIMMPGIDGGWWMIKNFRLRMQSKKSLNFWLKTEDRFSQRNSYWKRSLALTMRVMTVL